MFKDNIKPIPLQDELEVTKIQGDVTITLTDVNTGEVEEIHDHNMMTNALTEYFKNCGFLNYPNVNQSNMVEELLGGVMGFNLPIPESASQLYVPAGTKMTFNGSVGTVHSGQTPSEMGSYLPEESGWQEDGSYVQVYEFQTGQANGTIASVCIAGKNYAYAGEGNTTSNVRHSNLISIGGLQGSTTSYSGIPGLIFDIDLTNSTVLSFDIGTEETEVEGETVTTKVAYLRKYRIPFSKINLKGTTSVPIKLSEQYVNISEEDWDMFNSYIDQGSKWSIDRAGMGWQPFGHNLLLWNLNIRGSRTTPWGVGGTGDYTQYLWTLTPQGVLTRTVVINGFSEDLTGLQAAIFDGDYCFFIQGGGTQGYGYSNRWVDSRTVYVWNRRTDEHFTIDNSVGGTTQGSTYGTGARDYFANFIALHCTGDGRIVVIGNTGGAVIDAVLKQAWPTNANSGGVSQYYPPFIAINNAPLIRSYSGLLDMRRDQTYIATIFNLETPVVKTNTKMMRVVYRLTFNETEGTNS